MGIKLSGRRPGSGAGASGLGGVSDRGKAAAKKSKRALGKRRLRARKARGSGAAAKGLATARNVKAVGANAKSAFVAYVRRVSGRRPCFLLAEEGSGARPCALLAYVLLACGRPVSASLSSLPSSVAGALAFEDGERQSWDLAGGCPLTPARIRRVMAALAARNAS